MNKNKKIHKIIKNINKPYNNIQTQNYNNKQKPKKYKQNKYKK